MEIGEFCDGRGGSSNAEAAGCCKRQKISDHSAGGQPRQPAYTYQHRQLQAVDGEQRVKEDESLWFRCEICYKWRAMPIGHKVMTHKASFSLHFWGAGKAVEFELIILLVQEVPDGDWICTMHPDPEMASCDVKEEKVHENTQFTDCDGYVQRGMAQGQQRNVDYFQLLAQKHLEVRHHRHVLPWLIQEADDHETLLSRGIKVRDEHLSHKGGCPSGLHARCMWHNSRCLVLVSTKAANFLTNTAIF